MLWWSLRWAVLVGCVLAVAGNLPADLFRGGAAGPGSDQARLAQAASESFGSELRVRAGPNGHYLIELSIDSEPVDFLVDTGASAIVLSREDARRIGLRPQEHEFTMRANTANGVVRLAPMTARELRLGSFVAYDVEVAVNEAPMDVSLLGMAFLRRLQGYEVRDGTLHLRW